MTPDEKMDSTERRSSSRLSLIAIIILALLLGGTVAALIVFSLNTNTGCQKTQMKGEQVSADVTVNFEGKEVKEKINYDSGRSVAAYYNPDGSFSVDDYAKGIKVVKMAQSSECFVIPVGTNKSQGSEIQNFLKDYNGGTVQSSENSMDVQVMDGPIQDTSFLPQEAQKQCTSFKWLAMVNDDEGNKQRRLKRDIECTYVCFWKWEKVNLRYYLFYNCYILLSTCEDVTTLKPNTTTSVSRIG